MPDITMCSNNDCNARDYCYRQQAEPHPSRQSMSRFVPENNAFGEAFECAHFHSMQDGRFEVMGAKTK